MLERSPEDDLVSIWLDSDHQGQDVINLRIREFGRDYRQTHTGDEFIGLLDTARDRLATFIMDDAPQINALTPEDFND